MHLFLRTQKTIQTLLALNYKRSHWFVTSQLGFHVMGVETFEMSEGGKDGQEKKRLRVGDNAPVTHQPARGGGKGREGEREKSSTHRASCPLNPQPLCV